MFGRLGESFAIGLPGNPVSALVCAHLFLAPLVRATRRPRSCRQYARHEARRRHAPPMPTGRTMSAPGPSRSTARWWRHRSICRDSSMLSALAAANVLIVRPPKASPARKDDACRVLVLR